MATFLHDSILEGLSPLTVGVVGFGRTVNFLFQDAVPVSPGQTYFFQPVVQNSTNFSVYIEAYHYASGTAFLNGVASPLDLWFREGTYVPEPSAISDPARPSSRCTGTRGG